MSDFAIGLILSPALTALSLFVFKTWIADQIRKQTDKEIAGHKHELDVKKETIKEEITRTGLKAQFLATSKQVLYPELYESLRKIEGAVGSLSGFRYAPTYEGWSTEDFKVLLLESKLPSEMVSELTESISSDRPSGIKKLEATMRRLEFQQARQQCQEVKNKIILKSLFLSNEVNQAAFEIVKSAIGLAIDTEYMAETRKPFEEIKSKKEAMEQQLVALEARMKDELFGGGGI
jgi:hypothetical protein